MLLAACARGRRRRLDRVHGVRGPAAWSLTSFARFVPVCIVYRVSFSCRFRVASNQRSIRFSAFSFVSILRHWDQRGLVGPRCLSLRRPHQAQDLATVALYAVVPRGCARPRAAALGADCFRASHARRRCQSRLWPRAPSSATRHEDQPKGIGPRRKAVAHPQRGAGQIDDGARAAGEKRFWCTGTSKRAQGPTTQVLAKAPTTQEIAEEMENRQPIIRWALNLWIHEAMGFDRFGTWCPA